MVHIEGRIRSVKHRTINSIGLNRDAVFIWIPKSAGTSLYNSLEKLGCPKVKELRFIPKRFAQKGLVTFGHMDYLGLIEAGHVSREFDQRAKKFAIVRNPYDRATSVYFYIRDRHKHFALWHKTPSFEEFLELVEAGFHERIGLYNERGMSQANPQVAWTKGIALDYIGRVEAMGESIKAISDLLGKEIAEARWDNKGSKPPRAELYDKRTRYLVDKIYDEDFQTFNYSREAA